MVPSQNRSALWGQPPGSEDPRRRQPELQGRPQHPEPVLHASKKPDGRGLFEVPSRAGDLPDLEAEPESLCEHLVVEDEVVRVLLQRKCLQEPPGEGAVPGMVFRELVAKEQVLHEGEGAVRHVLPRRHPPLHRPSPEDAGAKHAVEVTTRDHRRHGRKEARRVLVVRVEHDHDVRASGQRLAVAGLLVAAIPAVLRVHHVVHAKLPRHVDGAIHAGVVYQHDVVGDGAIDLGSGLPERRLRVVGGHDHIDALAGEHQSGCRTPCRKPAIAETALRSADAACPIRPYFKGAT